MVYLWGCRPSCPERMLSKWFRKLGPFGWPSVGQLWTYRDGVKQLKTTLLCSNSGAQMITSTVTTTRSTRHNTKTVLLLKQCLPIRDPDQKSAVQRLQRRPVQRNRDADVVLYTEEPVQRLPQSCIMWAALSCNPLTEINSAVPGTVCSITTKCSAALKPLFVVCSWLLEHLKFGLDPNICRLSLPTSDS